MTGRLTGAVALVVLAAILTPHVAAAHRALTISRATFRTHRDSVRLGARVGRWQAMAVVVAVVALIGGAR